MESVFPDDLYLYCKADSEEQQRLAVQMAEHAEAYLLSIGIPFNVRNSSNFSLTVKALALHYMDNLGNKEIPEFIRGMINQLKFNH